MQPVPTPPPVPALLCKGLRLLQRTRCRALKAALLCAKRLAEGGYLSIEIDATADGGGSGAEETRWDSEEDRQSTTMGGPEGLAGKDSDPWEAGAARGDTGAWSDAHAVVVLCLILRQCGAADPQIVRLPPSSVHAPIARAASDLMVGLTPRFARGRSMRW